MHPVTHSFQPVCKCETLEIMQYFLCSLAILPVACRAVKCIKLDAACVSSHRTSNTSVHYIRCSFVCSSVEIIRCCTCITGLNCTSFTLSNLYVYVIFRNSTQAWVCRLLQRFVQIITLTATSTNPHTSFEHTHVQQVKQLCLGCERAFTPR